MSMIRFLEELSLSALPALQTVYLDGWVLRFSAGLTRRANSVNPLYAGAQTLEDDLHEAEALYVRRGLPVIFKLTPASLPEGLDATLAERGYTREAPTAVQTLDLRAPPPARPQLSDLTETLTDAWLDAMFELSATPPRFRATQQQMLSRLAVPACFAALHVGGSVVSLGLGVLLSGWLGLFDIVTRPEQRRRGYAGQLIADLLAWAATRGATGAYLQVMRENAPALALYDRLGFREAYEYWYRVKT